jgi:Fur family ferric uptake transcriptional regulator
MSQLAEVLRERGLRMTPQRQLILDAIESLEGHISAEAVHSRITTQFPQINISTVYRTLDLLEEMELVRHTHFDDGVAQYHLAQTELHQHLICRGCGTEQELDVEILRPLSDLLNREYGFKAHRALCQLPRHVGVDGSPSLTPMQN